MTVDEWAAWEADNWDLETARTDLIRIRGFALATAEWMLDAKERVDRAVDAMVRARRKAEREVVRLREAASLAERAHTFAARAMAGDVADDVRREAAIALEEIYG